MHVDLDGYWNHVSKAYYPMSLNKSRWQIIYGGSGSSKSYSIGQDEIHKQLTEQGSNLLIVRQTAKSNRTSTFPLCKQVISSLGLNSLFKFNKTDMTITNVVNNNEIRFGGLDDVEKLKSITFESGPLTRIWVEEASETKEDDIDQLNLRLRGIAPVQFQIRLSFNPISATHWLKRRFFDFKPDSCYRIHTTYKDNAWIDAEYKKQLEDLKKTNRMFYDVYCLGKWGVLGSLVFDNWESKKCPYSIEDFDEVVRGVDFGYNHPFALELMGFKDGEMWSFDELYVRERTNMEVIQEIDENGPISKGEACTADSAEPARIKEWQQHGYRLTGAVKGKDSVRRGVDYLKSNKWYVDPDKCPGLLSELQSFQYKEDKEGNKLDDFVNFKNDAIAACRYATERKAMMSQSKFFA